MAATSLFAPVGTHPFAFGPPTVRGLQSSAQANNTVLFLGVAAANRFAWVPYLYVRSSIAGELRIEDSSAVVCAAITAVAATWTFVDLGPFGVLIAVAAGDIGVRNLTGALSTIDVTGTWLNG